MPNMPSLLATSATAHPNGKFEVDDATCQDHKKYDLTFEPNFKVLTKKLD